jgi:hypothetical protein
VGKPEEKRSLRFRYRWKANIKINFIEVEWIFGVDLIWHGTGTRSGVL